MRDWRYLNMRNRRLACGVILACRRLHALLNEGFPHQRRRQMKTVTRVSLAAAVALALGSCGSMQSQQGGMSFFVTSAGSGKGADLGGLEGADRHCQQLAATVGAGGKTWRAYLSTNAAGGSVNARDRIGNGPWQNSKGTVIATSVDDLHSANN